jgi:hypothetical protein
MAISQYFAASGLISNVEWSLTTNTAGPDFTNVSGVYQTFINCSGMLQGDEYHIQVYEKTTNIDGDLALSVYESVLSGPQSPPIWVSPALMLGNGWDITMDASGAPPGRNFFWSIRKG